MNNIQNNTSLPQCDPNRIVQFLNADHYHLEDVELLDHLNYCDSCQRFMLEKSGGEEALEQAAALLKEDEFDAEATARFTQVGEEEELQAQGKAITKNLRDLLSPSEFPNHMGRLGPYEITGVVGVGGMGIVLKAIDPSLDRVVAVKLMNPRLANQENARKRFAREAKAAAAILHPNVVAIHSVSSGSTIPYLVMAYVRGGSLQKRLQQEGKMPLLDVLRIGSQIAAGLQAAHDQGLVHRDIKPENILLEEGVERVTITDFGLARAVDDNSVTQFGSIAGTPQYMSPEQAKGESIDHRSDLFSLGSLLYALCAGRPPFIDVSSYGVMRRIIDDRPVRLQELNPSIPEWFVVIINRLMAKNREDRYPTAGEVHRLLDACITHLQHPASAPLPDVAGYEAKSPQKRFFISKRGTIAMLALSTLMVCGTLWATGWLTDPPKTNEPTAEHPTEAASATKMLGSAKKQFGVLWTMQTAPHNYAELQLRWIHGGEETILQNIVIKTDEAAGNVDIKFQRRPNNPSLTVSGAGVTFQEQTLDIPSSALSLMESEPTSNTSAQANYPLIPGNTHLLYVGAYNTKDSSMSQSLPKLLRLSQEGATFMVVTFRWFKETLQAPADTEKAMLDRIALKGTWEVVRSIPPSPADDSDKKTLYQFEEDQVSISSGSRVETMKYRLTPLAIPKILDIDSDDVSFPCIYELDGDTLKIRFPNQKLECPQSFDMNEHSPLSSLVQIRESRYLELKRVK